MRHLFQLLDFQPLDLVEQGVRVRRHGFNHGQDRVCRPRVDYVPNTMLNGQVFDNHGRCVDHAPRG
jgi:hypothetical protein